jgi:hypothetical protein
MKAKLLPLNGKYYGTKIEIEQGGDTQIISIWLTGSNPSIREVERGLPWEEFENDNFESANSYLMASKICEAVNTFIWD